MKPKSFTLTDKGIQDEDGQKYLPVLSSQHSPTGDAPLPQWVVRLGLALVTAAGVLQLAVTSGSAWDVACRVVIAFGTAFGIASQWVRR